MPRKFGQHFLVSEPILNRIADAACPEHCSRVIEIGPGRGVLTERLLPKTDELHAIEIDPALIPLLKSKFSALPAFHLHQGDVLETALDQWGPAVVVGNLPYYITSPIVERFLKLDARFVRAIFMVQEEVADRLRASPGTRDYGYFSVYSQLICRVKQICRVPPGAFLPPPKVSSAVVCLERHTTLDAVDHGLLQFVGRCFAQKRKTLRNNLRPFYPPAILDALPEANLRAEQIAVEQFSDLYRRVEGSGL